MTWRWLVLLGGSIFGAMLVVREVTRPVEIPIPAPAEARAGDSSPPVPAAPRSLAGSKASRGPLIVGLADPALRAEKPSGPARIAQNAGVPGISSRPGGLLIVHVRGQGAALSGADVKLLREGRMRMEAATNAEGVAVFSGLDPGVWCVDARALDWLPEVRSVRVQARESSSMELKLKRGECVLVDVVEESTRNPVASAHLRLFLPEADLVRDAVTDLTGRAVLEGLPSDSWSQGRLVVQCEGYLALRAASGKSFLRSAPERAVVQLVRVAQVSGRVVDRDGEPVVHGLVHVDPEAHANDRVLLPPDSVEVDGRRVRRGLWARTDAEGRFALEAVPPASPVVLAVVVAGRPEEHVRLRLRAGEIRRDVVIRLDAGVGVKGCVWTPDQRAASGAEVRVARHGRFLMQVRTDEQGRFSLCDLKPGSYGLKACARPWIDSVVRALQVTGTGSMDSVQLQLRREAPPFTGRVVDPQGRPVSQVEVVALGLQRPGLFTEETFWPVRDRTDVDGRFRLGRIRPDWTYAIQVQAPGSALPVVRKPLTSPAPDLVFVVERAGGLEAVVAPEVAQDITHVAAILEDRGTQEMVRGCTTSPFQITGLCPGTYRVEARQGSVVVARAEHIAVRSDTITRNVRLMAVASPGVAGRVVDRAGRPLSGVPVAALQKRPGVEPVVLAAHTGVDGQFVLRGLQPGAHDLMIGDSGLGYTVQAGVRTGTKDLEIVLAPSCKVHAVVKDRESQAPVAGAAVGLVTRGGGAIQQVTDARGEVMFCISPGHYALVVVADGYEHAGCRVSVQPVGREVRREVFLVNVRP